MGVLQNQDRERPQSVNHEDFYRAGQQELYKSHGIIAANLPVFAFSQLDRQDPQFLRVVPGTDPGGEWQASCLAAECVPLAHRKEKTPAPTKHTNKTQTTFVECLERARPAPILFDVGDPARTVARKRKRTRGTTGKVARSWARARARGGSSRLFQNKKAQKKKQRKRALPDMDLPASFRGLVAKHCVDLDRRPKMPEGRPRSTAMMFSGARAFRSVGGGC